MPGARVMSSKFGWFIAGWMAAIATALLFVMIVATLPASAQDDEDQPGADRWPVKTAPPVAGPAFTVPIETLIALHDAGDVGHNDARFQSTRIPAPEQPCTAVPAEGGLVRCFLPAEGMPTTTTGWLQLVAHEDDGDFHVQLSATADAPSPCLVVEVPDPRFVTDPALKQEAQAVRAFLLARLGDRTPSAAGTRLKAPIRVTVTGALFFDDSHVGDPPRGKLGMKAGTLWELHPLTAIAFAP